MTNEMPWWRSKIIVGALLSIVTKLLVATGLTSEFSDADSQQLTDIVILLIGGVGDLVAIGSRVKQKEAPAITATKPSGNVMSVMVALFAVTLLLQGCAVDRGAILTGGAAVADHAGAPPPVTITKADLTKIDEQAGLLLTRSYTTAARLAAVAISSGLIKDKATIAQIGEWDAKVFSAVQGVRAAYLTGNADTYASALREARIALAKFSALSGG